MGHRLSSAHPIHHFDEDRANNSNGNLVVCEDTAYHELLHKRRRALLACGDPAAVRCRFCGGYDRQSEMHISARRDRKWCVTGYHRSCEQAAYYRRKAQRQNQTAAA